MPHIVERAEKLFHEKLYMDACPLYEQALSEKYSEDLIIRLASSWLEQHEDLKVIQLLSPFISHPKNPGRDLLLSAAYRHLGKHKDALIILEPYYNEQGLYPFKLELGLNYFYENQLHTAAKCLEGISMDPSAAHIYYLAQLYLERIHLIENRYAKAKQVGDQLEKILPKEHPLYYELAYLQGLCLMKTGQYLQAASYFEKSLPQENNLMNKAPWKGEALLLLTSSCQNALMDPETEHDALISFYNKAEKAFFSLEGNEEEKYKLAIVEFYIDKGRRLDDEEAYHKARQLLSNDHLFKTEEGKRRYKLLKAAAASNYSERNNLYHNLIEEKGHPAWFYEDCWFEKGKDALEQGKKLRKLLSKKKEAKSAFQEACQSFSQTMQHIQDSDKAYQALKLKALAHYYQDSLEENLIAWNIVHELMQHKNTQDVYYLAAQIGNNLLERGVVFTEVESLLTRGLAIDPQSQIAPVFLKALAMLYIAQTDYNKADACWDRLLKEYPEITYQGERKFWKAKCAEKLGDLEKMKNLFQEIYENDPDSTYAAPAYFNYYSYREYLQGSRRSLKHLQKMNKLFPDSPLSITANYLLGLDHKKDRISENGKPQHRKDLIAAIQSFQEAESTFDRLQQKNLIPENDFSYYQQIRYRANLERALANLAIARESHDAKKKVYLEYTTEVLKQLQDDFHAKESSILLYFPLLEEAEFRLAETYLEAGKTSEALNVLDHMLEHYSKASIDSSNFLCRLWIEKGKNCSKGTKLLNSP